MDIDSLRITHTLPPTKTIMEEKSKPPKIISRDRFLKGPIPMRWLEEAGKLNGKTLHTSLVIWHIAGMTNKNTVSVSSKVLEKFGVDRYSKSRAIKCLEQANLISVSRVRGRNPVVTILLPGISSNSEESADI